MTGNEEMMYGMSVDEIHKQFDWTIHVMGREMTVVSLLSDVQEVMVRGDVERARKWTNIAKYIMIEGMKQQRKAA